MTVKAVTLPLMVIGTTVSGNMVENHDHTIGQIEIEIGLPPGIKVHLNSKESRAFAS